MGGLEDILELQRVISNIVSSVLTQNNGYIDPNTTKKLERELEPIMQRYGIGRYEVKAEGDCVTVRSLESNINYKSTICIGEDPKRVLDSVFRGILNVEKYR